MDLSEHTKAELITIASWYGVELRPYKSKVELLNVVEALIDKKENVDFSKPDVDDVQMSVRVRRIKEQNQGD